MASVGGMLDLWAHLEVERGADAATIKKSYRRLVLLYHPDKHPNDRESAEKKIREINNAYETLSNTAKRSAYEAQAVAMEKKRCGVRLDTSGISPRMLIPKEFMLVPSGFPDKFVRTRGSHFNMSAFVHSREDAKDTPFKEFFEAARFTLWWVPQGMNNCCRIKWHPGECGRDTYVGMNMNFELSEQVSESPIVLNPGEDHVTSNVIVVASPEFQGAFRFESAYHKGHYLAFKPPTHLRMVGRRDDQTVLDFVLADYASAVKYMTLEEVLIPVAKSMSGDTQFVPITAIREDAHVQKYFQSTMNQAVWQMDDFETYFEGHWDRWDYDKRLRAVRVRGAEEKLGYVLRCAKTSDEVATIVADAGDEVRSMRLDIVDLALKGLSRLDTAGVASDVKAVVNRLTAQKLILQQILRKVCITGGADVTLERLISLHGTLRTFAAQANSEIVNLRREVLEAVSDLVPKMLLAQSEGTLEFGLLRDLLKVDFDWQACSAKVVHQCRQTVAAQQLESLIPVLSDATTSKSSSVIQCVADTILEKVPGTSPKLAVDGLAVVVNAGLGLDVVASMLKPFLGQAPLLQVASVVAALGEHGVDTETLRDCAVALATRESLASLPAGTLVRLAVAGAKSASVAEGALQAVCHAAAAGIASRTWSLDDISKLLLAASKPKGKASTHIVEATEMLFISAVEVLSSQIPEMSTSQLIKIVFAVGKAQVCRSFLHSAAVEATLRLSDVPAAQRMLLTQGFLPLGASNKAFQQILDYWSQCFSAFDTGTKEKDVVSSRQMERAANSELNPDQLAKLAQMLAPIAPDHDIFEALAQRLLSDGGLKGLTEGGLVALKSAFPDRGKPFFASRTKLLQAATRALASGSQQDRRRGRSSSSERPAKSRRR